MNANCTMPLAALLLTLAPLRTAEPQDAGTAKPAPSAGETARELERKARGVLGDAVDEKAAEIARRLRGESGATGDAPPGDDEDVDSDVVDEDDTFGTDDPVLERLTAIDERLCTIEALLLDVSTRGAAPSPAAAVATTGAPVVPVAGSPVTAGFDKARVRIWFENKEATVRIAVNGIPAGRFDSNTAFDLGPFLQQGRMNQIALAVEPRGKNVDGMALHVEGQMQGAHDYVAVLQFQPTKERLSDTFDLPWAPR
jgi:hypothetical protein